jgi:hypothetical protein
MYFEVLYEKVSGGTKGNHENNEDRCCPGRSWHLPAAGNFALTLSCLICHCAGVEMVNVLSGLHM